MRSVYRCPQYRVGLRDRIRCLGLCAVFFVVTKHVPQAQGGALQRLMAHRMHPPAQQSMSCYSKE